MLLMMNGLHKPYNSKKIILSLVIVLISISGLYFYLIHRGFAVAFPTLLEVLCFTECLEEESLHSVLLPGEALLNDQQPLLQLFNTNHLDKSKISILVEKSKYRLTVYYQQQPIKSYPVVFGNNPVGDKLKEGDSRTPEGRFKIKDLYEHPTWSKFLWIDYPNSSSWRKHFKAKKAGVIQWSNSIGGEVGIHGVPSNSEAMIEQRLNWTLGCISLKNQDVNELYQIVQRGTEVEIIP